MGRSDTLSIRQTSEVIELCHEQHGFTTLLPLLLWKTATMFSTLDVLLPQKKKKSKEIKKIGM